MTDGPETDRVSGSYKWAGPLYIYIPSDTYLSSLLFQEGQAYPTQDLWWEHAMTGYLLSLWAFIAVLHTCGTSSWPTYSELWYYILPKPCKRKRKRRSRYKEKKKKRYHYFGHFRRHSLPYHLTLRCLTCPYNRPPRISGPSRQDQKRQGTARRQRYRSRRAL